MKINNETLELIKQHRLPSYNEIPNVGLYLEQTSKYINEYLEPVMDTAVTGSMISNYVKKKLVANPVKKQYYRDQVAMLTVIAVLKSVISLDKVKMLLEMEISGQTEEFYNWFCSEFGRALRNAFSVEDGTGAGMRGQSAGDDAGKVTDGKRASENAEQTADAGGHRELIRKILITAAHKIYIEKILVSLEEKI